MFSSSSSSLLRRSCSSRISSICSINNSIQYHVKKNTVKSTIRLLNTTVPEETGKEPLNLTPEDQKIRDSESYGMPYLAQDFLYGKEKAVVLPPGAVKDYEKYQNGMPSEYCEGKMFRIFRPAQDCTQNFWIGSEHWEIEVDAPTEKWVNGIMQYIGTEDPHQAGGLRSLTFASKEDAVNFCERNGIQYYTEDFPLKDSQDGKIDYAANFLSHAVRARRARFTPKKLQKVQFSQRERGKDCWVNLKHTPYGKKESKTVSMTQWSDPHPNLHSENAKAWYASDLERKKELSRKLGK